MAPNGLTFFVTVILGATGISEMTQLADFCQKQPVFESLANGSPAIPLAQSSAQFHMEGSLKPSKV